MSDIAAPTVLHPDDEPITTTLGTLPRGVLRRYTTQIEDCDQQITTVEFCPLDCSGEAHRRGTPDMPYCFCGRHIHRSVHVHKKVGLTAGAIAGGF
jgi:hypothetical protein